MGCDHLIVVSILTGVTQDTKALCGLLIYSLTSLVLGLLVQHGLRSRRRSFLLPHIIFLSVLMMPVILSVFMFGFSPLVYLLLLPWTCILTLVRYDSLEVSRQCDLLSLVRSLTPGSVLGLSLVQLTQSWGLGGDQPPPGAKLTPTCPLLMRKLSTTQ